MIPVAFDYERATSIAEAIELLRAANGEARLLAGGHSLLPLMKLRLSEPAKLIDIGRIDELRGIEAEGDRITIGAMTTHSELERSDLLLARCPVLASAASRIGDPQVRNRGTIGGSLAHSDPGADLPAVVVALDATLHIAGPGGSRDVQAEAFFQDLFTVDLAADEILTAISVHASPTAAYAKLAHQASRYAVVGVAANLELDGERCVDARVAATGVGGYAQRLPGVESALIGTDLDGEVIAAAAEHAADEIDEINEDLHASQQYRAAMAKVFTRRALAEAAGM
jgi:carbon-monoxide dehydrogenase medium subunit